MNRAGRLQAAINNNEAPRFKRWLLLTSRTLITDRTTLKEISYTHTHTINKIYQSPFT